MTPTFDLLDRILLLLDTRHPGRVLSEVDRSYLALQVRQIERDYRELPQIMETTKASEVMP